MPVFYAAETYFLKAEAALQGWITGGTAAAKSYYEQGIQISMNQYGVEIGDYLSSTVVPQGYTDRWNSQNNISFTDVPTVAWENGSNKLQKIITQNGLPTIHWESKRGVIIAELVILNCLRREII